MDALFWMGPRRMRSLLSVGLAVLLSACGESRRSPTSPAPLQPTFRVTNVAIVGPPVVLTGSSVTYSVTATLSSGGTVANAKPTTWSSDNADVATIDSASDGIGELTARGPGTAAITAMYQGTSGNFSVHVRDMNEQIGGSNLAISFTPDPVPGSQTQCPGFPLPPPTWRFTELITETQGVGFKVEIATVSLYDENGRQVYLASDPEEYYFPPNSAFIEEACISLFGARGGFFADSFNGADDRGDQLAFASSRLRLLPVAGGSKTSGLISPVRTTGEMVVRTLRRVR